MESFLQSMGQETLLMPLAAFGLGMLTSLSPCMYPVIPGFLASLRGEGKDAFRNFLRFWCLLSVVMAILAVSARWGFGIFGSLSGSSWPYVGLGCLLALSGAAALSWVNLGLDQSLLGLMTGLIATPCATPSLSVLLTLAVKAGSFFLALVLAFCYALGAGSVFALAAFILMRSGRLPLWGPYLMRLRQLYGGLLFIGSGWYFFQAWQHA